MKNYDTVASVVLAAGRSSRMGRAKQLEVVDGEPMVVRATRLATTSGAGHVIVVTGAYAEEVAAKLAPLTATSSIQLVHNADWASGQASSVRAAIYSLPDSIQAVLFLPVDQPFVQVDFLQQLIRAWQAGNKLAAPRVDGEPRGAPAIFDRTYWPDLLAITGDVGGRVVLMKYKSVVTWIAASPSMLRDIDSPADLES